MLGRLLPLFTLACLVGACADPKYLSSSPPIGGGPESKLNVCQARFASGYCASIAWVKYPTETDFGSFLFKTFRPNKGDGSAFPVDLGGTPTVVLWMPSMGHDSSPVQVEQLDVGTFRATDVFFVMKGQWEIRIQLKVGNEIKDQAIIPITL